jgi:adenosylcobinamide kinase / adenosylcobinamide-phosphate guanylyltransferase
MDKKIIFITGGVRSGKSQFALELVRSMPGLKAYLATAQALDSEMAERIQKHRESRPSDWRTVEEPLEIANAIQEHGNRYSAILLDCLTLWLSNTLMAGWQSEKILAETERLLQFARASRSSLIMVSNEVGWGIVPEHPSARLFRDLSGSMHQKIAREADEVYFMICGLPQKIKGIPK